MPCTVPLWMRVVRTMAPSPLRTPLSPLREVRLQRREQRPPRVQVCILHGQACGWERGQVWDDAKECGSCGNRCRHVRGAAGRPGGWGWVQDIHKAHLATCRQPAGNLAVPAVFRLSETCSRPHLPHLPHLATWLFLLSFALLKHAAIHTFYTWQPGCSCWLSPC